MKLLTIMNVSFFGRTDIHFSCLSTHDWTCYALMCLLVAVALEILKKSIPDPRLILDLFLVLC